MKHPELKELTEERPFATDASGCLYDPRAREALKRWGRPGRAEGFEAISALRLAGKKIHMATERAADRYGLSEGRFHILLRLKHHPEHRMALGELADVLEVAPRTITGLIDNLERDGLVARVADPEDRRSTQAQLTDAGRQRIEAMWRHGFEQQVAITEGFTPEDLLQLRHLCLRVVQNLNRIEGGSHGR